MISGIRFLAAVVFAAVLGTVVGVPVLTMALVVPVYVVGPLGLGAGALAAALGAAWVENLFTRDRSRLLPVVAVAEASAVAIAAVLISPLLLPGVGLDPLAAPLIRTVVLCALVVAVSAGGAAARLRGPRGRLGWDGAAALLASVAALVLGLSAGVGWLLPGLPDLGVGRVGYGSLAWIGAATMAAGTALVILRLGRFSPGRELGRDAAATMTLVAAILPGVIGTISFACSNLVGCGA